MPAFTWHVHMHQHKDGARSLKAIVICCAGREVVVDRPDDVARLWAALGRRSSSEWEHNCLQAAWHRHQAKAVLDG